MSEVLVSIRAAVALAAVGAAFALLGAASAAASTHPDFPLGDTDPENWSAATVSATSPEFDAGTSNLWGLESDWEMLPGLCTGGAEGTLNEDGSVEITYATWKGMSNVCSSLQAGEFPWTGEICFHEPTETFWNRQNVEFEGFIPGMVGVGFAQVNELGMEFGVPPTGSWHGGGTTVLFTEPFEFKYRFAVLLPFENAPQFAAAEGSCGWSELQA